LNETEREFKTRIVSKLRADARDHGVGTPMSAKLAKAQEEWLKANQAVTEDRK
jgi:hypothetical protein